MPLMRAAFQCQDDIIRLVVLCAGCYQALLEAGHSRHWSRPVTGAHCEFCIDDIRREAL